MLKLHSDFIKQQPARCFVPLFKTVVKASSLPSKEDSLLILALAKGVRLTVKYRDFKTSVIPVKMEIEGRQDAIDCRYYNDSYLWTVTTQDGSTIFRSDCRADVRRFLKA